MLTIGKLVSLTNVSNDTLRHCEQVGLVELAGKSLASYRLYDKDSARRIRFIKHPQNCGFTLAEIRQLVLRDRDNACCGDVRTRAVEKKLQIENKIRAMKAVSKALDQLIAECAMETRPVKECTIIAALERANARFRYSEP